MNSRSLALRAAGFSVEEAYTFETALPIAEVVDVLLICHSWPDPDKKRLVSAGRNNRTPIPVICVNSYPSEAHPDGCVGVENAPLAILDAIAAVTHMSLANGWSADRPQLKVARQSPPRV
jgi:hypothetical protein